MGVAVLCLACGPQAHTPEPQAIEIQPANATVEIGPGPGAPIDYIAIGHYPDGHTETLDDASFSLHPGDTVGLVLSPGKLATVRRSPVPRLW